MNERQKVQSVQMLSGQMLDDPLLSDMAVPQEIVQQLHDMITLARREDLSIDWRTLKIHLEENEAFPDTVDLRVRAMARGEG